MTDYRVDPERDYDLQAALESGGEAALTKALDSICTCGHARREHAATTGALGSFGGSACGKCWACGTYVPAEPHEAADLADLSTARHRRLRCIRARLDGRPMLLDDQVHGTPEGQLVEFRADVDDEDSRLAGGGVIDRYDSEADEWVMRYETLVEQHARTQARRITAGLLPQGGG